MGNNIPASQLAVIAGLAFAAISCSGEPAPDNSQLAGSYQISGVRVLPNGTGDARVLKITIVDASPARVVFDFDSGDVAARLPARDTAVSTDDHYAAHWIGNGAYNHALTFNGTDCTGHDIDGVGAATDWATCNIQQGN
ncbi:MAG: hypothetical protein ACREL5_00430 [Gemmatimonadales bacterium]